MAADYYRTQESPSKVISFSSPPRVRGINLNLSLWAARYGAFGGTWASLPRADRGRMRGRSSLRRGRPQPHAVVGGSVRQRRGSEIAARGLRCGESGLRLRLRSPGILLYCGGVPIVAIARRGISRIVRIVQVQGIGEFARRALELPQGAAQLLPDLRQLLRPEEDQQDNQHHHQLNRAIYKRQHKRSTSFPERSTAHRQRASGRTCACAANS